MLQFGQYLFCNSKASQHFSRKYIGIVLSVNGYNYFAPLSSFKPKHKLMNEALDFIKVKDYAVINLNSMFPVPDGEYQKVIISAEKDGRYRSLLLAEYRFIHSIQDKIRKNAMNLYKIKTKGTIISKLTNRCNDFLVLEKAMSEYMA